MAFTMAPVCRPGLSRRDRHETGHGRYRRVLMTGSRSKKFAFYSMGIWTVVTANYVEKLFPETLSGRKLSPAWGILTKNQYLLLTMKDCRV